MVPQTRFYNYAPFIQAEVKPVEKLLLQAGVRYEHAELEVDSFKTLYSTNSAGGVTVEGGSPSFDETLFNFGFTYQLLDELQLFANRSEGFGMPDIGRVLRGISEPGQEVDELIDLQPIVTDNREVGIRVAWEPLDLELSYYESDSDLGSRLALVNDVYEVRREKVEIRGVEVAGGVQINTAHRVEITYANSNGEYDSNDDGEVDTDLLGTDISPDRLTLRWRAQWNEALNTLLQTNHYFDRILMTANMISMVIRSSISLLVISCRWVESVRGWRTAKRAICDVLCAISQLAR